jgi:hypothetical protein
VIAPELVSVSLGSSGRDDKWASPFGDRRKGGRITIRKERFLGRGLKLVMGPSAAPQPFYIFLIFFPFLFSVFI